MPCGNCRDVDCLCNYLPPQPTVGEQSPKFKKVFCSQCGGEFGPRDSGYSECKDHAETNATIDFVHQVLTDNSGREGWSCGTTKSPAGWFCTRELGHSGPCAAESRPSPTPIPVGEQETAAQIANRYCDSMLQTLRQNAGEQTRSALDDLARAEMADGLYDAVTLPVGEQRVSDERLYAVVYEDPERQPMYFTGEGAEQSARAFHNVESMRWNCRLLCDAPSAYQSAAAAEEKPKCKHCGHPQSEHDKFICSHGEDGPYGCTCEIPYGGAPAAAVEGEL